MSDSDTLAANVVRSSDLYAAPRLRELRRARVLSQAQLAKAAGVARTAIVRLETGGVARAGTLHKLAAYFGIRPDQLMREPPSER